MADVTAKHANPLSTERKATLVVLVVAAAIGLLTVFGPAWLVRVGLLVAVAGAATSVWLAFTEMARMEVLHRKELKTVQRAASAAAAAHHEESMELIGTLQVRSRAHWGQLTDLRTELAMVQQELSTLRGNLLSARNESTIRLSQVAHLRAELDAQRAELEAVRAQLAEVEGPTTEQQLVTLPRRVVSRKALAATLPSASELWHDGDHPTLVNEALANLPEILERRHA